MSKIGVFDSGFGGLTVLKGIRELLPEYDYIYLGDNARAPYGSRSHNEVFEFTKQAVDHLFEQDCELIVLACNTASSGSLRRIQQEYLPKKYPRKRVLGVLIPACEKVVEEGHKKVAVLGTETTINSGTYIEELKKIDPSIEVIQRACPGLVPLIESGVDNGEELEKLLDEYTNDISNMEAVILGCTHYEIINDQINRRFLDFDTVPQSKLVAEKLVDYLKRHPEIETKLSKNKTVKYFSTDCDKKFKEFGKKIIGSDIEVEKISLN